MDSCASGMGAGTGAGAGLRGAAWGVGAGGTAGLGAAGGGGVGEGACSMRVSMTIWASAGLSEGFGSGRPQSNSPWAANTKPVMGSRVLCVWLA